MKKILFLFILFLIVQIKADAQNKNNRVLGIITDSLSSQILPFAHVSLLKENGNKIAATITDVNGAFIFKNLEYGSYQIQVTYIGYSKVERNFTLKESENEISLSPFKLILENNTLKEVKIKASKPLIQQEANKVIMNISESILSNTGSLIDVLKFAPFVIGSGDKYTLKGKKVKILVDGKVTNISGESLEGLLSSFSSQSIEKIELISNPGAKYDADGAAVINIRTLKMKNMGTSGSINTSIGGGMFHRYNLGTTLNYKTKNISLLGNVNYSNNKQYLQVTNNRIFNNGSSIADNELDINTKKFQFAKIGIDYNLAPQTTISILFQGNNNLKSRNVKGKTIFKNSINFDSTTILKGDSKSIFKNYNTNIGFKHILKETRDEFKVDLDFGEYTNDVQESNQLYPIKEDILFSSINIPWLQNIDITSFKSEYSHTLKNGSLDLGIQLRRTNSDMNLIFEQILNSSKLQTITNNILYHYLENVNALYFDYSLKQKKISYELGMRVENTNVNGQNLKLQESNSQKYTNFFPSLNVTYSLNENNQFTFDYNRKIYRPEYSELNSQIIFINQFRYYKGNPQLKPSLTNSIGLNFLLNNTWSFDLNYITTKDETTSVPFINDNTTYYQTINFRRYNWVTLNIGFDKTLKKWWTTSSGIHTYKTMNYFDNQYGITNRNGSSVYIFSNNYFTFKNWKIDVTPYYLTSQVVGLYKIYPYKNIGLGVQKSIWNKKGDIRFTISDLLNIYNFKYRSTTSYVNEIENVKRESRFFKFSFTYKLGNTNVIIKSRKTVIESENNRINTGNK